MKKVIIKPSNVVETASTFSFPPVWKTFVDEIVPQYVKQAYSPREKWKNRPFTKEDAHFYFKGIEELSTLFTDERPKGMPAYFQHPKFRSSYLLYFLPLQAAKFLSLYHRHTEAIQAALEHAQKTGCLRIADLGVGPGTASLALLIYLLNSRLPDRLLPKSIELHWLDVNYPIMKDGVAITHALTELFPQLRERVTIKTYVEPWWKTAALLKEEFSLTIAGHVLNESTGQPQNRVTSAFWLSLLERNKGGGILFVEPAARKSSQLLSKLRNDLFSQELLPSSATRIWGPCLHAQMCPLSEGRDWCHFSVPSLVPGEWFKYFSTALGSERLWLKYSYLWFTSEEYPSPEPKPTLRRVISDPLNPGSPYRAVLLCEPTTPGRFPLNHGEVLYRGDLVSVRTEKPVTPRSTPIPLIQPRKKPYRTDR